MKKFNDWFNRKFGWFFTNGNKSQYKEKINPESWLIVDYEIMTDADLSGIPMDVLEWLDKNYYPPIKK